MLCSRETEIPDGTIQKLEAKTAQQNTCNAFFFTFFILSNLAVKSKCNWSAILTEFAHITNIGRT